MERAAGVLMHISSLPGRYGIGTFGAEAYRFADFLKKAKQKYWQVLPLGPISFGDSPYQSPSTFAINPYFIDLDLLKKEGFLTIQDYEWMNNEFNRAPNEDPSLVYYNQVIVNKDNVLRKAYENSKSLLSEELAGFVSLHSSWLKDYSLYMALKSPFDQKEWLYWDEEIKRRRPDTIAWYEKELNDEIKYFQFIQYIAYKQWDSLKSYINEQGIEVIGDIPIYASGDSADTWALSASGIFKLDQDLTPLCAAGCPPDYFSEKGQYWGNTVYDWKKNKITGYSWWIARMKSALTIYDWVRIDHFRGFQSYWEVPYGAPDAISGSWQPGPGIDFIQFLKDSLGSDLKIIAEDLGFMTEDVKEFVQSSGFPGMKILEFAFDAGPDSEHLPHNYDKNTVVYTGTHDNDTVLGWLLTAKEETRSFAIDYFKLDNNEGYNWGLIRGALSSPAKLAVIPMQDLLGLGSEARMNIPSTLGGRNWRWRMDPEALTDDLANRLAGLTRLYGRG